MQRRGLPYSVERKTQYRRKLRRELREIDSGLAGAFEETTTSKEGMAATAWQLLAWLLPLGLPGWFGSSPKATRRRPRPFTKGEWTKVARHFPVGFNPNSRDQVRTWLFESLSLRPSTHTDGGKPSVNADALNRILQRKPTSKAEAARVETARPILYDLMHRARLQKIDQDYLDPDVRDGRVFPRIKMEGTEGGRYAYADPPVHSWPPEIRHLVAARPDHVILSADFRAIEYRVWAYDCGDPELIRIFDQNANDPESPEWDIHIRTSCELFGWKLEEFLALEKEKQKGARLVSKTFAYGVILYRGKPETAQTKVVCPCPRCADKVPPTITLTAAEKKRQAQRWFMRHPHALRWQSRIDSHVARHKWLDNPFGRRRYFSKPWGPELAREASNWRIQSTAREIIRRAEIALHRLGHPLILQHHDSLVEEVPADRALGYAREMREVMEAPIPELGGRSFPCEVSIGPSWGELQELPHGPE